MRLQYALILSAIIFYILIINKNCSSISKMRDYFIHSDIIKYCKDKIKNFIDPENIRVNAENINIKYSNKIQQNNYLRDHNIPVLKNYLWDKNISNEENIEQIISKGIKFPVVIKPPNGTYGRDVKMNVSKNKLLNYNINGYYKSNPMVEEQTFGKKYRIYLIKDNIIAVHLCTNPVVIGDNESMLKELISKYNNSRNEKTKIKNIDIEYILNQVDSFETIIEDKKNIELTPSCNLNNGGNLTNIDIENTHPDNIKLFKDVYKILKYSPMGIDYIGPDISIPYHKENGIILEVNVNPGQIGLLNFNKDNVCRYFS